MATRQQAAALYALKRDVRIRQMRDRRERLKAAGRCVNHPAEPAISRTLCFDCLTRKDEQNMLRRDS